MTSTTLVALPLAWALALQAPPAGAGDRCARGAADACREAGRALLAGPGPRLGVAHVMLACEMGDGPACADLGALHALGRGVAWDAARALALSRRACEGGVAHACANWGVLAAEEAGGLAALAGTRAGLEAVRRFRAACDAAVAEGCLDLAAALRVAVADPAGAGRALARGCDLGLGLACHRLALLRAGSAAPTGVAGASPRLLEDPASLALVLPGAGAFHPADLFPRPGPAGPAGAPDPAVELLLPARRLDLAACAEAGRAAPGTPARLSVTFSVGPDGRAAGARAASEPAEPALEACAAEAASAWEFPAGEAGPFTAAVDLEPLPGGAAPVYPGPGGLRPALREPGCVERAARFPAGTLAASVTLKLAVTVEGRAALVRALAPAPGGVIAAAAEAARACRWSPGTGPDGRPATTWTTLTVRVAR